jgi:hypothetical protein
MKERERERERERYIEYGETKRLSERKNRPVMKPEFTNSKKSRKFGQKLLK